MEHQEVLIEKDLGERIEKFANLIFKSRYPVFFTGAGISTESGLPDFRGPDGLWTRREKGLPPLSLARSWEAAAPNRGHLALVELQELGKLKFLISQNVDHLHLKSGIRPERLAELHGNMTKLRCLRCKETVDREAGLAACPCGGPLASSVVNFGQPLPERELIRSLGHSRRSDLFVVAGSSLVVTPAADLPREALRAGADLVIINGGDTPLDGSAHLRFREKIGEVLPRAVERLRALMGRPPAA